MESLRFTKLNGRLQDVSTSSTMELKRWVLGTLGIAAALAMTLIIIGVYGVWADVPVAPEATLVVTSTADSGVSTLRQALLDAASGDTITFDVSVFLPTNPVTIALSSQLPDINQGNLTIDASNAGVIIDGSGTPTDTYGLYITSNGNTIKGLQVIGFPVTGIAIAPGAKHNTIGGDRNLGNGPSGEGNIITLNKGDGISISGSGTMSNTVVGNLIGLDLDGTVDLHAQTLAVSPGYATDETIFVGTEGHGIFKSTNGGSSWTEVNTGLTISNVQALETSPDYAADQTLFAGTAAGGVFKATDGGGNWLAVNTGLDEMNVQALALSPEYGTDPTLFAGTDNGIFKSADGGSHWTAINSGLTNGNISALAISPNYATDGTIFASTRGGGVFKSTDRGLNWGAVNNGLATLDVSALAISPNYTPDQTIFVGTGSSIFKSTDGGGSWVSKSKGLSDVDWIESLAFSPDYTTDQTVFASAPSGGVYKSTDGGGNWTQANNGLTNGDYVGPFAVSPNYATDQTVFLAAQFDGVFKSDDGGSNWTSANNGLTELGNYGRGVSINAGAQWNTIGGDTPGKRNVISNNSWCGINIGGVDTDHNTVTGNYIGTDATGSTNLRNWQGVCIGDGAQQNVIGGTEAKKRNVISGNGGSGVSIGGSGTMSNTVSGNFIGTDATGSAAVGNGKGVSISNWGGGAQQNMIGGTTEGERNIISGNDYGVVINGGSYNQIVGNYLGVDATGVAPLGNNSAGAGIGGGEHNVIQNNVIAANGCNGIDLYGTDTMSNTVRGNLIGTDAVGTSALANGCQGIWFGSGAHHNTIGGSTAQDRNIISGNNWGVGIAGDGTTNNTVTGNFIGTDISGTVALGNNNAGVVFYGGSQRNIIGPDNTIAYNGTDGVIVYSSTCLSNTITHNSIYSNTDLGIDNVNGGNTELPPPVITSIAGNTITGTACAGCIVEVFSDDAGEGRMYEGTTTADGSGNFSFTKASNLTGPHITATATDAAGNTSEFSALVPLVSPSISGIMPNQGTNDVPGEINIYGLNFAEGISVSLGTTPPTSLNASRPSSSYVRATVPAGLASGTYDLTVSNPGGGSDTLGNAYTVFDAGVENDDLYAQSRDLWSDPISIRQGEQTNLGLLVHRQGGKNTLSNVIVRFYDSDPDSGGAVIGDGTVYMLSPRSSENTTRVPWMPATAGDYVIYARIDPANAISETIETNNTISNTVTVLPPAGDTTPPVVTSFTIDDGAETTTVPTATLTVSGEDDVGGSEVDSIFFVEFEFVQAAMQWVPVQASGWLSYTHTYSWTLVPVAGVRYMQAWAADRAGNISLYPYKDRISYLPPSDQVAAGQVRVYRQYVGAGQRLTVIVTPISGDPDLYVWPPTEGDPAWVSNNSTGVDQQSIVATESGTYQIEVYGYSAAEYTISVSMSGGGAGLATGEQVVQSFNAGKPSRPAPMIPASNEPSGQMAVPTAPVTGDIHKIYLPLIMRQMP